VTVRVGMSPGERARQANALMQMLTLQVQLASQGMDEVLTNATGFYRTLMAWARVSDIRNPEQFFIDPQSKDAQDALAAKVKIAQQSDAQRKALMGRAIGIEEIKALLGKYLGDQETQYKYWKGVLDSEVEEAKIVGNATADLLAARETPNVGSDTPLEKGRSEPTG
jgi:hypothetical protein